MNMTDFQRLERILTTGRELLDILERRGITVGDVQDSTEVQWMVTTPLYNIGERVYCLTKEFKQRHCEIAWSNVSGLRHRLVHDYDGISWQFIADVLFNDLPGFLLQVDDLLKTLR